MITVLAGGTGGAKLARGLCDAAGARQVTVIANTADDVEVYGAHVSPDPDLVTYWLADVIHERGWGLRDDTWQVMAALKAAGADAWFNLGDRDLALCLLRTELLRRGERLTVAQSRIAAALGVQTRVLPMCDEPVSTQIRARGQWRPFQRFMIEDRAEGPIEDVRFVGVEDARPSEQVLNALGQAEVIVIGPSNPVISIGPILAVPGMRAAIKQARATVVGVSPFVAGRAIKGPTEMFFSQAGLSPGVSGVLDFYGDLLDGIVADEPVETVSGRVTDVLMADAKGRRHVASQVLEFASTLRPARRR